MINSFALKCNLDMPKISMFLFSAKFGFQVLLVLMEHMVVQVLELGIVVHSVIIGISLGASESPSTIKPLVAALSFHQFFEGMGLGGCIVQVCAVYNQSLLCACVRVDE